MDPYFDILSSESKLRDFLKRLKEFDEFDQYVITYVEDCLKKRVIRRPSKGSYGEQGKDIVAVENESEKSYCSYVVKNGNLDNHLEGKYGIIKQMNDAMTIGLEENEFKDRKRTVVVVHNGIEGNRAAINKYEKARRKIEEEATKQNILLKEIERWDLSKFSNQLYPYRDYLLEKEFFKNTLGKMQESLLVISLLRKDYVKLNLDEQTPSTQAEELLIKINRSIVEIEKKYGPIQVLKKSSDKNDK